MSSSTLYANSNWVLETSTLTYHTSHPMHHITGESTGSKGKGACTKEGCDFLVGVPVSTFKSGDENRDLHMIQAINGAAYPMISVRTHLPTEPAAPGFKADLTVNFGGQEVVYPNVSFDVTNISSDTLHAQGILPLVLSKHEVKRPALLGVAIKDDNPVDMDIVWHKK